MSEWIVVAGSDRRALDLVDGAGRWIGHGPHYSRRSPGAATFTGVGRDLVLLHETEQAVWAVVYARVPCSRNGRNDERYLWRNMLFRNLGAGLSSALIVSATHQTYVRWQEKYGALPAERLRTEIDPRRVKSRNPGYCYRLAGWTNSRWVRGKLYLEAPVP